MRLLVGLLVGNRVRRLLEGLLAAVLGLGSLAVLVLLLWTVSPHADGGLTGALRLAADLWLLAHGAELLRPGPPGAPPAPVGVTPLLLTALPCCLLLRAVRVAEAEPGPPGGTRGALWVAGGYLLGVAAAVAWTASAPIAVRPGHAAVHVPPFVLLVAVAGAWATGGAPAARGLARRLPPVARRALTRRRLRDAVRVAAAGLLASCVAGALLAAGALLLRVRAAQESFGQLGGDGTGRLAVLLLTLTLIPNAALWAVSYGLGPGFALGAGAAAGPLSAPGGGVPGLPPFPLFDALPAPGPPEHAWAWAAAAVVPAAGLAAAVRCAIRTAVPLPRQRAAAGWAGTALTVLLAACLLGLALGLLAGLAGGPLGTGRLAAFGPSGWAVGPAATAWTALVGVPAALAARAWRAHGPTRLRPRLPRLPRPARRPRPDPGWHPTHPRTTRWSALRKRSGTLVPDIPPED